MTNEGREGPERSVRTLVSQEGPNKSQRWSDMTIATQAGLEMAVEDQRRSKKA